MAQHAEVPRDTAQLAEVPRAQHDMVQRVCVYVYVSPAKEATSDTQNFLAKLSFAKQIADRLPTGSMATMLVFVKGFTGKTFGLHVRPHSTVHEVKLLVLQVTGVKPDAQHLMYLMYGGRQLEDGRCLRDCGVKHEATLHLVARLRGMISSFTANDVSRADVAYLMLDDEDRAKAEIPVEELRRIAALHNANPSESFSISWPSPLTSDEMAHLCKFLQCVWDDATASSSSAKADETSAAASSSSAAAGGGGASESESAVVGGGESKSAAVGGGASESAVVGEIAVGGGGGSESANHASRGDLKVVVSQKQLVEILLTMHKRATYGADEDDAARATYDTDEDDAARASNDADDGDADGDDTDVMARAMATTQDLLALFKGPPNTRAKIAFRMTVGPTDACIPFHCDGPYATSTTQIALNSSKEYRGGRLVYCTFEGASAESVETAETAEIAKGVEAARVRLHVTERPAGTVTHHRPKIVHGVTRMVSGTRYSLFVLDEANGLGDKGVLDLTRDGRSFSRILRTVSSRHALHTVSSRGVLSSGVSTVSNNEVRAAEEIDDSPTIKTRRFGQ